MMSVGGEESGSRGREKIEVRWREGELIENKGMGARSAGMVAVEMLDAFVGGCRQVVKGPQRWRSSIRALAGCWQVVKRDPGVVVGGKVVVNGGSGRIERVRMGARKCGDGKVGDRHNKSDGKWIDLPLTRECRA